MTNECVMHTVEPRRGPAQLICLVNTAQVNLTTKTPSLLPVVSGREAGSRFESDPRKREGLRGWTGGEGNRRKGGGEGGQGDV